MKLDKLFRRAGAVVGLLVLAWFAPHNILSPGLTRAQQNTQAPPASPQQSTPPPQTSAPPLKAEARVVRVDVVVTDKKGNYVHDLTANDFKVYEDNKQLEIANFAFGGATNPASPEKHYMVLYFDDSTMDLGDQPRARDAAAKFIETNAGPDRLIAVMEFGGALRIVQNFTADPDLLKQAVAGIKFSAVAPNAPTPSFGPTATPAGMPGIGNPEADFGAYTLLLSIRSVARNLAAIPGRKSLVVFTAGFPLNDERQSELTATIDACNKANVAVYPLDVRGLVAAAPGSPTGELFQPRIPARESVAPSPSAARAVRVSANSGEFVDKPSLQLASYSPSRQSASLSPAASAVLAAFQGRPGGGGGAGGGSGAGGGGRTGGGTGAGGGTGTGGTGAGGGRGGTGGTGTTGGSGGKSGGGGGSAPSRGTPANPYGNPNYTQPRAIVPTFPPSATTNQQVMYELASGTGGFPILNTNDLLAGLQKIGREQNEYYLLGFAPPDSPEGSCHTIHVKVDRGGTEVRSRSGYCNVRPKDILAGKPVEKDLEARATSEAPGANIGGTLETPFFYTSPEEARVDVSMEIPSNSIAFDNVKGKYHADVNILGIASKPDGSVGARFSDEVSLDLEKDEWKSFTEKPMPYRNQFAVAPGQYKLTVVLSGGGQNFGKYEAPLNIDAFDGKTFTLSGIALSNEVESLANLGGALDADLLADRTPLVIRDMEVVPSGSDRFKKTDKVVLYAQIYDPNLQSDKPPVVKVGYRIVDEKTGKVLMTTGAIDATNFVQKGSPLVPFALKIPLDNVPPGTYRVDVQAIEQGGAQSHVRTATFVADQP